MFISSFCVCGCPAMLYASIFYVLLSFMFMLFFFNALVCFKYCSVIDLYNYGRCHQLKFEYNFYQLFYLLLMCK